MPNPIDLEPRRKQIEAHEPKLIESREMHEERDARQGKPPRMLGRIAVVIVGVLLVLLAWGMWRRHQQQSVVEAAAKQEEQSLPIVDVIEVRRSPAVTSELLPGNMTPMTETYIYARANGYVKTRYHDIGDRVQQGEKLAEIEAPDLDEQVRQARASLEQAEHQVGQANEQLENARSQEDLTKLNWDRYRVLVAHGAVSRQDADQNYTNYRSAVASTAAAQANVHAAEQNSQANRANLNRMIALQSYEIVRAPFTGVITARNFDVGALVGSNGSTQGVSSTPLGGSQNSGALGNAGQSGTSPSSLTPPLGTGATPATGVGTGELFRIAQLGTLRILLNVPQESVPFIHIGQAATINVSQFATEKFQGKVARTANTIDMISRTLLVEVDVPNPNGRLLPGMYAEVRIDNVRSNPPLLVPGDTIITGARGVQVAIAGEIHDKKQHPKDAKQIHLQNVQVGRDYGAEIEVVSGLEDNEDVVVNPSDAVEEGAIVRTTPAKRSKEDQQRQGPSDKQGGG